MDVDVASSSAKNMQVALALWRACPFHFPEKTANLPFVLCECMKDRATRMHGKFTVVFVCTANRLRSPTAEDVFRDWPGIDVVSAGTDSAAPRVLTKELVEAADAIFAMEAHHREKIRKKFKKRPRDNRIITLYIQDEYERGDPELVSLLRQKVAPKLKEWINPC